MTTLVSLLDSILRPGESLKMKLHRERNQLILVLEPVLTRKPEGLAPEAAQVRAHLATPLRLTGSAQALEGALIEHLTGYAQARQRLGGQYEELLDALREAGKDAQVKLTQVRKGVAKPTAPGSTTLPPSAAAITSPRPAPLPSVAASSATPPEKNAAEIAAEAGQTNLFD